MASNWGRGSTRKSRRERLVVLARDPICYLQLPGCTQVSTIDEHVHNRAAGGSNELSNRRGACASCNELKRQQEAHVGRHARSGKRPPERHPGLRHL